ncbi:uncharacterized protein LOC112464895 [Temnothorax curvispinosus]|uniref:Uncharacterized protein LOC112464895 n=1 Tax=Temnothorax curvispinosus TaxID=300111 RepID=A0A6J1R1D3_9HYME|nr:uncharacterized protein LOC112464895 [Temnothorax curvispinosus]
MKILMHHFTELDKKYELLKTRFWLTQRNFKALTDKYMSVKDKKDKLKKKQMFYQMHRETPRSAYRGVETPSSISVPTSESGYSMESLGSTNKMCAFIFESTDVMNILTPMGTID